MFKLYIYSKSFINFFLLYQKLSGTELRWAEEGHVSNPDDGK